MIRGVVLAGIALATTHAYADVPDPTLRAVRARVVRLEMGSESVEGRLLSFERDTITLARTKTNEVITVPRAGVERVIDLAHPIAKPERLRVFGAHTSLLGTVAFDADYRWFYGFAGTSLALPILTESGNGRWFAAAVGAGLTLPLGDSRRWKLDVFAETLPLRTTSHYTYVAFGLGSGVHYTGASGFSFGVKFPVLGFATRLGSSPTGFDAPFRYNDSLAYFYLAGFAGMPLLTFGYRFNTNCPRR